MAIDKMTPPDLPGAPLDLLQEGAAALGLELPWAALGQFRF